MTLGPEYARLEALVASSLRAPDPASALRAGVAEADLGPELSARLAAIDDDGFRVAALLVVKLRFERVLAGSATAGAEFEEDPEGFTRAFRAYHREVPPLAFGPAAEAASWHRWRSAARP